MSGEKPGDPARAAELYIESLREIVILQSMLLFLWPPKGSSSLLSAPLLRVSIIKPEMAKLPEQ